MVELTRFFTEDDITSWLAHSRHLLRALRGETAIDSAEAHLDVLEGALGAIEAWVNSSEFPDRPNAVERVSLLYWSAGEIRRYLRQGIDPPNRNQVLIYALYVGTSCGQLSRYVQRAAEASQGLDS